VQLQGEPQLVADGPHRVEHPEAGPAHPRRHVEAGQQVVGDEVDGLDDQVVVDAERHGAVGVDRAAVGDDAGDVGRASVGGRLVAEHAALAVAAQVHRAAGDLRHLCHRLAERDHVIGQRALEAAGLPLRCAEVDHPRIDPTPGQLGDRARRRGHVVDVGRQHHRWHEEHGWAAIGRRGAVAAQVVDAMGADHLERRRLLARLEPAEPGDLECVLRGLAEPDDGLGHASGDDVHRVGEGTHFGHRSTRRGPSGTLSPCSPR
jgi:hypothetical protein